MDEKLEAIANDILDKLEKAQETIHDCYRKLQELGVVTVKKAARELPPHGQLMPKDVIPDDPLNRIIAIRNLACVWQMKSCAKGLVMNKV